MSIQEKIVYDLRWDAGSHICFLGDLTSTIISAVERGMYACQFFLGNPKSFKRSLMSLEDISTAKAVVKRYPISVFSHAPYLFNLAGSKNQLAWVGDIKQDSKTKYLIKELTYELSVLSNFPKNGVIVHPGNNIDRKAGLKAIAKSINRIEFTEGGRLLLENSAGQGTSLATTFKEIASILKCVDEDRKQHVGVCVDTAHIFGYGDYNLSTIKGVDKLFKDFIKTIGIEKFWLLHLNDSKVSLGSKKDRHAFIGEGHIWGKSTDSLVYLLEKCQEYGIPMCLETCPMDMTTLQSLSDSMPSK